MAGLGAGDVHSDAEDRAFGVEVPDRIARLTETVARSAGRGYPVWVGGLSPAVRRLAAARADGWNAWGLTTGRFAEGAAAVRHEVVAAGRDPESFACSWGGLAVLGGGEAEAAAKRERLGGDRPGLITGGPAEVATQLAAYRDAGAAWVIVGPVDSSRPENAAHLAAARALVR
jgi:alkanesulfonate monooxygenase SsuD/methylene tetrahydromethanopterin reductase-like flavin-dependent oxidoreductase (luciferase family)